MHYTRSPNEPSQRQLRVGEQLRHIIAETMARGHFHNEILTNAGRITVTEVRVSPDLKHATAFVMALGGENMHEILPALNEAAPMFQKEVGRQNTMKFTPRIKFVGDDSFAAGERIESLLRDIHQGNDDAS